jgi:hypothetical protein
MTSCHRLVREIYLTRVLCPIAVLLMPTTKGSLTTTSSLPAGNRAVSRLWCSHFFSPPHLLLYVVLQIRPLLPPSEHEERDINYAFYFFHCLVGPLFVTCRTYRQYSNTPVRLFLRALEYLPAGTWYYSILTGIVFLRANNASLAWLHN